LTTIATTTKNTMTMATPTRKHDYNDDENKTTLITITSITATTIIMTTVTIITITITNVYNADYYNKDDGNCNSNKNI
jgi:hypothetical protein